MITSSQRVSPDSPEVRISFSLGDSSDTQDGDNYTQTFPDLEQQLQPVLPRLSLKDSVHVYKEHCRMAGEFCQVKHDIAALEERKCQLLAELVEDQKASTEISRLEDEFRRLSEENRTLVTKHGERSRQLQRLRRPDSS